MPSKPRLDAIKNVMHVKPINVEGLLKGTGLPDIKKPSIGKGVDESFNTLDLPVVSSKQLSRYLQYASGMLSYSLVLGANFDNEVNAIDTAIHRVKAMLRVAHTGGGPKYKTDAAIMSDPHLAKLQRRFDVALAKSKLIAAHIAAYESRVSMISREVSRRGLEYQQR